MENAYLKAYKELEINKNSQQPWEIIGLLITDSTANPAAEFDMKTITLKFK